ncbi:hypothetical protein F2Q69_00013098 [Brassica cretica]|uniref:Uncharacterized protein n=1 Tax=Brassica cretica TaxID=69181 RepID=A0A8S9R2R4_BRACR|nr:hypothetical protein F2Q69_00013098 [Brassica cretica]
MRMSKCEDCEEVTSVLIGMRNYYLLADFWTRTSPKYTNLDQTRHTAHWDLARNPRSQRAGGLTVGVKNGYDEVNVQIPEEEKRRKLLRQILFEIDSYLRKALRRKRESLDKSPKRIVTQRPNTCSTRLLRSVRVRAKAQSLRSNRTPILIGRYVATKHSLGRYVATGLEPKLGRYVAIELEQELGRYVATELFRNIDTTLVHAFSSTLRCYLPKTIANPFHDSPPF